MNTAFWNTKYHLLFSMGNWLDLHSLQCHPLVHFLGLNQTGQNLPFAGRSFLKVRQVFSIFMVIPTFITVIDVWTGWSHILKYFTKMWLQMYTACLCCQLSTRFYISSARNKSTVFQNLIDLSVLNSRKKFGHEWTVASLSFLSLCIDLAISDFSNIKLLVQ